MPIDDIMTDVVYLLQAEKEEREAQEKEKRAQIEAREAKKREAAAGPKKGSKKK
jgi:hypothetical protein